MIHFKCGLKIFKGKTADEQRLKKNNLEKAKIESKEQRLKHNSKELEI